MTNYDWGHPDPEAETVVVEFSRDILLAAQTTGIRASKTVTFTGAASHGAVGSVALFTVTGVVQIVSLVPRCTVDLVSAGGGTVELGISGQTDVLVPTTTGTLLTAGKLWLTGTPATGIKALPAALKDIVLAADIILTIATANVTAGAVRFDLIYRAISTDGDVEAV